jgi:hypothetical protein
MFECDADAEAVTAARESGGPGAGAWLLPPTQPAHRFSDQEFVTAMRLRIRQPVFTNDGLCVHRTRARPDAPSRICSCTRDILGRHALMCNVGGGVTARHNAERDMLAARIHETSGKPVAIEQHDESNEDDRHPDLHFTNDRGEVTHVDVSIVTPTAGGIAGSGSRLQRAGALVALTENTKRRKYPRLRLLPAVSAHLGRPGTDLIALVRSMHGDDDEQVRSIAISATWQDWSCTLQKYNVASLANAGPLVPP